MATIERRPYRGKARLGTREKTTISLHCFSLLTMMDVRCYEIMASHICMNRKARACLNRQAYHVSYLLVVYHMVQGSLQQAGLVLHYEWLA